MGRCTVLANETGNLTPLIISALNSQGVHDAVAAAGIAHPLPIVSKAWSSVESALMNTVDALEKVKSTPGAHEGTDEALDAYQSFLYRCAEFVEAVEKQVRAALGSTKSYKAPRALDRILSEQCNAIKHDHMRLRRVSGSNGWFRVSGYQLRHHVGSAEVVAKRFHAKRPSISFNTEIRRIWSAAYILGDHAGRAVISAHGPAVPFSERESAAVDRILGLAPFVFPQENKQSFPFIRRSGAELEVALSGGPHMALNGPIKILSVGKGDGFTRTFDLPKV